jgi:hypothetical protein
VAPWVSFPDFCEKYFPGMIVSAGRWTYDGQEIPVDRWVPYSTAHSFWEDYKTSDAKSLKDYIRRTTSEKAVSA